MQEPALDCALRLRAALDGDQPLHKTLIFSSAEAACDELRWMVDVPWPGEAEDLMDFRRRIQVIQDDPGKISVIMWLNMSKQSYSSTIFNDRVEASCRFLMILTYSYSTKAIQSFVVVLAYTASHIGQSLGFVSFVLVSIQVLRGISVFKRQGAAHLNLRPFKVDR